MTARGRAAAAFAAAAFAAVIAAGCTNSVPLFGPPTQSQCAAGSALTYESFGRGFMERYCTRCHASTLRGEDRQGAPSFHDFDTLFGIKAVFDHVDETTASGPAATNTSMPPDTPSPTLAERQQLGEWLACGMPSAPSP
jgi:cytochrome c5